jgi:hypothetical protein
MRLRHTTALLGLLVPMGTFACSDANLVNPKIVDLIEHNGSPMNSPMTELSPAPEGCRSVASASSVRVGDTAGDMRCNFDEATAQLACRTAAGDLNQMTTSQFASTADFVEAAALGKVTSLREERLQDGTTSVVSHEFDELGRLVRSREERALGNVVYQYGDYDVLGRPQSASPSAATRAAWECDAPPLVIEYGDEVGTIAFHHLLPGACQGADFSVIEYYDPLGNRVRIERDGADGLETRFEGTPLSAQVACE